MHLVFSIVISLLSSVRSLLSELSLFVFPLLLVYFTRFSNLNISATSADIYKQ